MVFLELQLFVNLIEKYIIIPFELLIIYLYMQYLFQFLVVSPITCVNHKTKRKKLISFDTYNKPYS